MSTVTLDVTSQWVKITTGTNTAACQVHSGSLRLVDSPTEPAADTRGHTVADYMWVNITPPTVAWVRTNGSDAAHVALTTNP